ncbi:MAG: MFS transporter [Candidatus Nanopelagicales bacterium]
MSMESASVSRWAVPLLGVAGGVAMADPNVASTALVEASRGLAMPTSWIPVAASVENYSTAATVVTTGLLADRLGRRRVFMAALALVAASELLTAAAPVSLVYLLGRAITGIAMGAIFGAAFAYVRAVAKQGQLGSALGVFGAAATVTMMVISLMGGGLASLGWRLAFCLITVLALLVLALVPRLLPPIPTVGSGPADIGGQILLGIAVVLPLYALSRAGTPGPAVWAALAVGVIAFVGFVMIERLGSHPFFPLGLFRDRIYLAAILMGLGWNMAQAILVLQLANLWQYIEGWSTMTVALATLPAYVFGMAASVYTGRRVSAGVSPRTVAVIGFALMTVGFAVLAWYRDGGSLWPFPVALVLVGMGTQAVSVPYGALIVQVAPRQYYGPVTSSRTTIGQMGYAVGLAGATVLIDRMTTDGIIARLQAAGVSPTRIAEAQSVISLYVEAGTEETTQLARMALQNAAQSYAQAFATTMGVVAAVMLVMGVGVALLLRGRSSASSAS